MKGCGGAPLLLAAILVATSSPAAAQAPVPAEGDSARCSEYFASIKSPLDECQQALSSLPPNDTTCPKNCKGIFAKMPAECAKYVDMSLPDQYQGANATTATTNSQTFDICQMLFCPTEVCGIALDVLRSMALFQLPYSVESPPPPSSSGTSVNVAAIVAGVVAGNAAIVVLVGGFVYFRRRRQQSRWEAEQRKALATAYSLALAPHGGAAAGSGAPSSGAFSPGARSNGTPTPTGTPGAPDAAERGASGSKQVRSRVSISLPVVAAGGGGPASPAALESLDAAAAVHAGAGGSAAAVPPGVHSAAVDAAALAAAALPAAALDAAAMGAAAASTALDADGLPAVAVRFAAPYSAVAFGTAASRGPRSAFTSRRPSVGMQAVAQLWAQAARHGAAYGWPPPQQQPHPSPPPSSSTVATTHMQQDEVEMMRLGSSLPSGAHSSINSDPLLSWVGSQLQQQGSQGRQALSEVAGGGVAAHPHPATVGSDGGLTPPAGSSGNVTGTGSGDGQPLVTAGGGAAAAAARMSSRQRSSGWMNAESQRGSGLVDLKAWQLQYSELKMQRPLGEGSFGKVFLATWNETLVAVKLLLSTDDAASAIKSGSSSAGSFGFPAAAMEALQKEAGLMASLRHPNVVLFLGVCESPPAVVTEYCSRGSLLDVLRTAHASQAAAQQLTWVRRLSMALDAAKGMLCLHVHNPPIVHRDLKSPNLLVDAAWRVKVCDFNLSKLLEDSARSSSTGGMLNPRWLAPEVLMGQPATAASDVFSFGTVLWELLTWQLPWQGANLYQLVFMVSQGERLTVPLREQLPGSEQLADGELDAYVALMRRCWSQQPAERPAFADIITELRAIMTRTVAANSAPASS